MRWLGTYQNSNVDKKTYEGQVTVRLCNYTDVYYNEFIKDSSEFMAATASKSEISSMSLKKGDIIITKDSEDPTDIGIPAIVSEDLINVVCGYHLTVIRVSETYQRFVHRLIQADSTKARFYVESPGITRYGLNQDAIGGLSILMPPPDEAVRLANFIDRETARIDALISKKTRFIALLREKRQALITHAVTKGLDPNIKMKDSGVEWLGEVPEHWEVTHVKRLVTSIFQGWSPECEPRPPEEGEWGVLKVGCVNGGQFRVEESKALPDSLEPRSELAIRKGDVLVSRANTRELVGSCAVVPCDFPKIMLCDKLYRLTADPKKVSPEFLAALISVHGRRMVEIEATGASSSMVNIAQSVIMDLPVAVPDVAEQKAVANYLQTSVIKIDLVMVRTERSIELLKERRSALITAAVTGQIDLREAA